MTYKSLLCVVTERKSAEPALAQMTTLADRLDSHAEILCMGLDRTQLGYYDAGATAMVLQESIDRAQSDAAELLAFVNETMNKSDIRWSAEESDWSATACTQPQRAWLEPRRPSARQAF